MLLLAAAAVRCGSPRWRCRCSPPMGCVDYHTPPRRRGLSVHAKKRARGGVMQLELQGRDRRRDRVVPVGQLQGFPRHGHKDVGAPRRRYACEATTPDRNTTAQQCVRATQPSSRMPRATVLHGEASPTDSENDPAVQEACFDGWRIIRTQIGLSRGYSLPAASLQPARRRRRRDSAAAAAIPPRARARRCRLLGNILAGVAAHTNAPQRVRFISNILVRPQLHLHVTLSPPIPLENTCPARYGHTKRQPGGTIAPPARHRHSCRRPF
jgi:hypothetical protein